MPILAHILKDSVNTKGCRLTTFLLTFPRIILPEVLTHRVFSRNTSSSRAIPLSKMIRMVKSDPFIPIRFQKPHKGMQGTEYYEGSEHDMCVHDWLMARDKAVEMVESGFSLPITKQLANRILEPFSWTRMVLSGTEFDNFYELRDHEDAEIHIKELARQMKAEALDSNPVLLHPGEKHVPFGDCINERLLEEAIEKLEFRPGMPHDLRVSLAKDMIAVARIARTSYLNFDSGVDYAKDIELCNRLFAAKPKHLSPTEHVAVSTGSDVFFKNFRGFEQFRSSVE